jgi:hypothetical protein
MVMVGELVGVNLYVVVPVRLLGVTVYAPSSRPLIAYVPSAPVNTKPVFAPLSVTVTSGKPPVPVVTVPRMLYVVAAVVAVKSMPVVTSHAVVAFWFKGFIA